MKAVVYSVRAFEKEYFAKANKKKHDITLIANPLGMDTVHYAEGKEAVIMPEGTIASKEIRNALFGMGIKYIITRCATDNTADLQEIAEQTITDLDKAREDKRFLPAC